MQVTELERKFIENTTSNDFGEAPDHSVWNDCWDCGRHGAFMTIQQAKGVFSSLCQKVG